MKNILTLLMIAILGIAPIGCHSGENDPIDNGHAPNNESESASADSNSSSTNDTNTENNGTNGGSGTTGGNTNGGGSDGGSANEGNASDNTPYIDETFNNSGSLWKSSTNTTKGAVTFAYDDAKANDGKSVRILFGGDTSLGSSDKTGPNASKDIDLLEKLGYGIYKFRVKPATCSATDEEMITGVFTYANDGNDRDNNGMVDNNEIDIEFACSYPEAFWLTIWTDYQYKNGVEMAKRQTRRIRFTDGQYKDTIQNGLKSTRTETKGSLPSSLLDPSFDQRAAYLTLGFEWRADFVRFFIEKNGAEIDLWKMTDASYVPKAPADFIVNLWHASTIWSSPSSAAADYPKADVEVLVDWFKYWN